MAKYYLHIDPSEETLFQKPTKLLYIDDSDPDILLYCFEDGTKCSSEFISPMSDTAPAVGLKKMIEIELPTALWKFKKNEAKAILQTAKNKMGESFMIPDPYFTDLNGNRNISLSSESESGFGTGMVTDGVRYDAYPPRRLNIPQEELNTYYASYIKYAVENNMDMRKDTYTGFLYGESIKLNASSDIIKSSDNTVNNEITDFSIVRNNTKNNKKKLELSELNKFKDISNINIDSESDLFTETKKLMLINADNIINSNNYDNVKITYKGQEYIIPIDKFFELSITEIIEKPIILKEEKKEEIYKLTDNDIDIDIINTPEWSLVNNMINMSQKENCDIDMALVLSLPPVDVYKLIKTVYPDGMADAFVKTIANRMPIKLLKEALASGLMAFYNDTDIDNIKDIDNIAASNNMKNA